MARLRVAAVALLTVVAFSLHSASSQQVDSRQLAQSHSGAADAGGALPVPFTYCKPLLEHLTPHDQHQLRESYQQYHAAYARFMRAARNHESFQKGPATWLQDEPMRQGWNLTYLVGQNLEDLTRVLDDANSTMRSMEARIKTQLTQLQGQGRLPAETTVDGLSPCIMRRIYPSQFPDQPAVSLLLRLRGEAPNAADWPTPNLNGTKEPPSGKGPEVVAAFLARLMACRTVAPMELIVMLSGRAAVQQASTWAWQSWTTEGFVVPMLDSLDREAHSFNRMAAVARGSVLVALRADSPSVEDLLPPASSAAEEKRRIPGGEGGAAGVPAECAALQRLVTLYHRIPQLGAMSHGRFSFSHPATATASLRLLGSSETLQAAAAAAAAAGSGSSSASTYGLVGGGPQRNNMYFQEKVTAVPFQYVLYGDLMPMSFRRSALEEVGGMDEDLPQGDEPCSSRVRRDVCLRLWKSGWRVGAHDTGLVQLPRQPPTPAANSDPTRCSPDVAALSEQLLESRHGPLPQSLGLPAPMEVLMGRVKGLNVGELGPLGE
ncbi:hypothetical protein Agub_g2806, partial [Astrephomene gubernaculifera]